MCFTDSESPQDSQVGESSQHNKIVSALAEYRILAEHSFAMLDNANIGVNWIQFIAFRVSRRRRKMYCGHARLCVCVCVCPPPRAHTTARTRM